MTATLTREIPLSVEEAAPARLERPWRSTKKKTAPVQAGRPDINHLERIEDAAAA